MNRFQDKVVLLTGASSGIGAATALRLCSEGARVFGVGRDTDGLKSTAEQCADTKGTFVSYQAELGIAAHCQETVAACKQAFGSIDCLINCAGAHKFRSLGSITEQQWFDDLNTNLSSAFFLSQAAMPTLIESAGNVVNVGSLASVEGQAYSASYASAKHALVGLTKALAVEFAKTSVRVNIVCPGGTDTPQIGKVGMPDDADFDLIMRSAGMRGFSEPSAIAAVIAFLASDDARAINGSVHMADQGKTAG